MSGRRSVLDVEHELAVEQDLEAVARRRPFGGVGRVAVASAACVAGPATPSRPSPCHFWNAITANRVCSPALPSTASAGRNERSASRCWSARTAAVGSVGGPGAGGPGGGTSGRGCVP